MNFHLLSLLVVPVLSNTACTVVGFATGNSGKMEVCRPRILMATFGISKDQGTFVCKGYTDDPKDGFSL